MMNWLVQTLVGTTMLMALVMAVRKPVARAFGARIAYALWALPAIRMVLPALPGHRQLFMPVLRIAPQRMPVAVGLVPADATLDQVLLPATVTQAPLAGAMNWPLLIVGVWAAGAALFFAWQLIRYRLFVGRALQGACLLSVQAGVEVLASPRVSGPVAAGIVRRRIFLPVDFLTRFTSDERRQALLHEGAHHDRRDILANLGALAVLAAHWWNPIAHIAYRGFRADQELACDATVLEGATPQDRFCYGSALVKAGGTRMPTAACALDNGQEIKRRLMMMKQGKIALGRRAIGILIAVGAIGGGLLATASGSYAAGVADRVVPPAPVAPLPPVPPPPAPVTPKVASDGKRHVTIVRIGGKDGKTMTTTRTQTDADAAAADADRAAAEASREAAEAGRIAAEAGRRAGEAGRRAAELTARRMMVVNPGEMVRFSLDEARNGMARRCAEAGTPVRPGEKDWSTLATCDRGVIIASLETARAEISANRDIGEAERAHATASLDGAIARMKAEQRR